MVIDAHQHFWVYDSGRHDWIDDAMGKIRRDFLPKELEPVLCANGMDGCIAVQAEQMEKENDFLLKQSQEHAFIKGIIGWVDLRHSTLDERLDYYSGFEKIKGFRHMVQGETDPNFLLRPDFLNGISRLKKHDFCYELLVFPHQLGAVLEFVKMFPEQRFVIDHLGKPYIKDGFKDGWAALMREIGRHEQVYCKVSGLVTEADYNTWTYQSLEPYLEIVLECFGAGRLMYGSDWPVCLAAATYDQVKAVAARATAQFSDSEQRAFWGENAQKFYKLAVL